MTTSDDPNTENMQGHLNTLVEVDIRISLTITELNRAPLHDDAFRMKCLRFFAENITMDGQFTNQGDYDEGNNNDEQQYGMFKCLYLERFKYHADTRIASR